MGPKPKMWTDDIEYKLCVEIEKRPILWDPSCTEYKRADKKDEIWEEIGKLLGPQFTGAIVKKRFTNMKETFADNERRIKDSKMRSSGNGTDDNYKVKWSLHKHLIFLRKVSAQAESFSNLECLETDESLLKLQCIEVPMSEVSVNSHGEVQMYYDDYLKKFMRIPPDTTAVQYHTADSEPVSKLLSTPCSSEESSKASCSSTEALSHASSSPLISPSPCQSDSMLMSPPPERPSRPASASSTKSEPPFFEKRGGKRSQPQQESSVMKDALAAIQQLANAPISVPAQHGDSAEGIGLLVAARLREMDPEKRRRTEDDILKYLTRE